MKKQRSAEKGKENNMEEKKNFLAKMDAKVLQAELLAFLDCDDIEVDSLDDFADQFVDFIEEDFSYGDVDCD